MPRDVDKNARLSVDLHLPGDWLRAELQMHHEALEEEVQKGIEEAIKELKAENTVADFVKRQIKETIKSKITRGFHSWDIAKKITENINKAVEEEVKRKSFDLEIIYTKLAEQALKELKEEEKNGRD